jgi:hypothetical protein
MGNFTSTIITISLLGIIMAIITVIGTALPGAGSIIRHYAPIIPRDVAEFVVYILSTFLEIAIILYICDKTL